MWPRGWRMNLGSKVRAYRPLTLSIHDGSASPAFGQFSSCLFSLSGSDRFWVLWEYQEEGARRQTRWRRKGKAVTSCSLYRQGISKGRCHLSFQAKHFKGFRLGMAHLFISWEVVTVEPPKELGKVRTKWFLARTLLKFGHLHCECGKGFNKAQPLLCTGFWMDKVSSGQSKFCLDKQAGRKLFPPLGPAILSSVERLPFFIG